MQQYAILYKLKVSTLTSTGYREDFLPIDSKAHFLLVQDKRKNTQSIFHYVPIKKHPNCAIANLFNYISVILKYTACTSVHIFVVKVSVQRCHRLPSTVHRAGQRLYRIFMFSFPWFLQCLTLFYPHETPEKHSVQNTVKSASEVIVHKISHRTKPVTVDCHCVSLRRGAFAIKAYNLNQPSVRRKKNRGMTF